MKWFDKWFKYQVNKALREDDCRQSTVNDSPCVISVKEDVVDYRKSINLKMQTAHGGTIVEVSHYDTNKEEWERDLYILTDEQDLPTELSSILVQHNLRKN